MGNILDAIQEMDKMKKDIGRDAYNEIRELQSKFLSLKQFTAEKIDSNKEDDLNE